MVVEFPTWLIVVVLLFVALRFFGDQIFTIGIFLFMGFVLMSALKPIVDWFEEKGITKGWAIGITYTLGFLLIAGLISLIVVPFGKSVQEMLSELPMLVSNFLEDFNGVVFGSFSIDRQWFIDLAKDLSTFLTPSGSVDSLKSLAGTVGGVFNWVTLLLAVIIFSMYLLFESDQLLELGLLRISNDRKRKRVKQLIGDVERKLGKWLIGQTVVSLIAGTTLGAFLSILGVPFALPLGVLVGLLDTIPSIGATVATIPAVLIALISGGWTKALVVLVVYSIYQQIENNFLVPKVMGTAVGLKPMFVMLGVFVFLIMFGIWGAALAVPVMVVIEIFYDFFIDLQKLEAEGIV